MKNRYEGLGNLVIILIVNIKRRIARKVSRIVLLYFGLYLFGFLIGTFQSTSFLWFLDLADVPMTPITNIISLETPRRSKTNQDEIPNRCPQRLCLEIRRNCFPKACWNGAPHPFGKLWSLETLKLCYLQVGESHYPSTSRLPPLHPTTILGDMDVFILVSSCNYLLA